MPESFGNLSGPGSQQVWVRVARVSMNEGGNFWTFLGQVRYYGNGYGSWGGNWNWSADFGGYQVGGGFSIPSSQAGWQYHDLFSGYFDRGADGNGYSSAFGCSAYISTNHTSVGSGGASTTEEAAPRIPKKPTQPSAPSFYYVTPTTMQVVWSWEYGDMGGSEIDAYLLRSWPGTPADPANTPTYRDESIEFNGFRNLTGLTPGETRTYAVYAHNGAQDNGGFSLMGPAASITMPSGVFVSDGKKWIPTQILASDGSSYDAAMPKISTGSSYNNPTQVTPT